MAPCTTQVITTSFSLNNTYMMLLRGHLLTDHINKYILTDLYMTNICVKKIYTWTMRVCIRRST